tara:strand:+ start:463 stop:1095 length:633 start_codon:yes stop_codon:yes gene_type:complete
MNYKTRESTTEHIVDHISEDVILENAYDNHHVTKVHSSTTKDVSRIYENGNVSIIQYELYKFPGIKFLKNFTQKFIAIKITSEKDVQFYSTPCNFDFVSKNIINCEQLENNKIKYISKFYFKPMNLFFGLLSPLVMFLRNKGEKKRLQEDQMLWRLRQKSKDENFKDTRSCVTTKEKILINEWFPGSKIKVTDLFHLFNENNKDKINKNN